MLSMYLRHLGRQHNLRCHQIALNIGLTLVPQILVAIKESVLIPMVHAMQRVVKRTMGHIQLSNPMLPVPAVIGVITTSGAADTVSRVIAALNLRRVVHRHPEDRRQLREELRLLLFR
jgi:hypothetical protein